jgi:hypothetical protein
MVFHDERTSWSQLLLMKSRQQSANISAATNALKCAGCGFLA